jgi:flagellar L-ring protein precursor FlgH
MKILTGKSLWILVLFFALGLTSGVRGQAPQSTFPSLYSDNRAHRVGDVVTIYIVEFATASNSSSTSTDKKSTATASGSGTGALKFLPVFGMEGGTAAAFRGEAKTARNGVLKAKMTARITAVDDNGNFVIEGSREVTVNSDRQLTVLQGIVRPEDITSDNVVYSYNIANAKISYRGKGTVNTGQRPGILTRLINWIF